MSGFKTPPLGDFQQYEGLISTQGGHFSNLGQWCTSQCAVADGLDGLLYLIRPFVHESAGYIEEKIAQCVRGMNLVESKVKQTAADYGGTDQDIAAGLLKLYPTPLPSFPDLGSLPLPLPHLGNFQDHDVDLGTDKLTSAHDDTTKAIHLELLTLREGMMPGSGPVAVANKVFKYFTGQDLITLVLEPILGDFGRLKYLSDVYGMLGDGLYTVAGTLRKGSFALGQEWVGQTAEAFDSYMFSWSMGVGGMGDAAKVVSKVYRDGFYAILALLELAMREINKLAIEVLPKLAEDGAQMVEGDAAIEAVGLGPEDLPADAVAGVFSAYEMYKMYTQIAMAISIVNTIEEIYHGIQKALEKIVTDVEKVIALFGKPLPTVGSLINMVEQRGFEFEKDGFWDPTLGAARIGMLPAA